VKLYARNEAFDKAGFQKKATKQIIRDHKGQIVRARSERRDELSAARSACESERKRVAAACGSERERIRGDAHARIDQIEAELRRQREQLQTIYEMERLDRGRVRSTPRERKQQSDDDVTRNLEPDLVPVWNAVKRTIKARPGMDRTEAFMQWVHDSPDAVAEIQARMYEPDEDELARQEEAYWHERVGQR